nr:EamA family transporter [Oculatella sp. LEGE 06141]
MGRLKRLTFRNLGQPSSKLGFLAIAIAATLWAIAAIVASGLFQAGVGPFELALSRAMIAAVGLAVVGQVWRSPHRLLDGRILLLGLSLALVTASYYVAIDRLSVAVAIVIQYTAPAIVVVIKALNTRQLPAPMTVIAVVAALSGVAFVSGLGTSQLQLDGLGLIAAGLSAIFFTSYTLFSEAVVDTYGATGVMFRGFIVSSLFWLAFQVTQGFPTAVFLPANLPGIVFVGIGGTLVPFSLLCWGIQQVRAERGAIAATLEPVFAAVLAWIWLGQTLSVLQMVGGGLVLAAVVSLQLQQAWNGAKIKS